MSPGGVDENTGLLSGYASGARAALTCSLIGDSARRATITGTAGRIEVPRDFFCPAQFTLWHGERPERVEMPFEGWATTSRPPRCNAACVKGSSRAR
ncbi:hypothetical protein Drose_02970 [Dactylosporangium roseum]|uniref:Uncharacterized protein n=1 Tax=Dactylosporangium roseum TaxID=47989 RepID=A0ABY5Z5E5_9ACTN|nr:hypothetical protein [Dactylosporangium roseum]UWZ37269.1 hypothetical protein Drose_02970 [Dactylosporangium roseum]